MSEIPKLKVGILGCGPIAQFAHLEACRKAGNVTLHAVCDTAADLAAKMGTFYDADKIYNDYEEMLSDNELEAVIVATADQFHLSASLQAIEWGKHVLVEKPLGDNLDEANRLKEAVEASGLVLQVGHMKRFDPGIAFARSFIEEEMGEMIAYKAWYCDSTHRYEMTNSTQPISIKSNQSIKPSVDPKSDVKKYFMLAHGSHLIDTAHFLAGEIISVQARLLERNGMFSWFVDTEFAKGCNGHLDLTVAVRMDWHEGFQVYGDQGSVLGKIYNPWYFKVSEVRCFSEKDRKYQQILDNKAHFFQLQLESFAQTILRGKPLIGTDIYQGIDSIKAMMAIAQSAKNRGRVYLKDVKGGL